MTRRVCLIDHLHLHRRHRSVVAVLAQQPRRSMPKDELLFVLRRWDGPFFGWWQLHDAITEMTRDDLGLVWTAHGGLVVGVDRRACEALDRLRRREREAMLLTIGQRRGEVEKLPKPGFTDGFPG